MTEKPNSEHVFWARGLNRLAREQAQKKGVPDHVMAQAMMVQAWMLFTGQSEEDARLAVRGIYSASLQRTRLHEMGPAPEPKEPTA